MKPKNVSIDRTSAGVGLPFSSADAIIVDTNACAAYRFNLITGRKTQFEKNECGLNSILRTDSSTTA